MLRSHQPELQSQDNLQAEFPDLVPLLLFPGKHLVSMFLQSCTQPSLDTLQRVQQTFFYFYLKFSLIRVQLADNLNEVEDISFQPWPSLFSFQVPLPPSISFHFSSLCSLLSEICVVHFLCTTMLTAGLRWNWTAKADEKAAQPQRK